MIHETDPEKAVEKMAGWLVQHYPGLKLVQLAIISKNNRAYGRTTFTAANRQQKVVLFDITKAAQNNLSTSMRIFPAGTVVRLWPGSGSTPARLQVVWKMNFHNISHHRHKSFLKKLFQQPFLNFFFFASLFD